MIEKFYSDITIKRNSAPTAVGSFGNPQPAFAVIGTVKGFIEQATSGQILAGNAQQIKVTNSLYSEYPSPIALKHGDKVVCDGKDYRIVSEPEDVSGRHHHIEALLERLDSDV